jgi:hypothetical protein
MLGNNNESAYINKIRQAQIRQQQIYDQHLQKYTLPMSLNKIITEAKQKSEIEQGIQKLTHKDQYEQQKRK